MNKKLVALAVAGVFAAPLAAQAQTANVTLYGRVNIDLEFVKAGSGASTLNRVSSNSSRIGVKGEESLGSGLKAIFQIESSVSTDAGGGTLGARDTFAGITGNFGTFRIGNMLTPYDDIHPVFGNGPTYLTSILSTAALWANGTNSKVTGGFDARLGNSLRWDSPTMGGFSGGVQYTTFEDANKAFVLAGGAQWKGGPATVRVGFEKNDDVRGNGSDDLALSLAGNYTFGNFTVGGVFERLDYDGAGADFRRNFWGVSVTAAVGPGRLYAFYGQAGDGKGSGGVTGGTMNLLSGGNTGAKQYEVSYTYDLSKRTSVYAGYVRINNESGANYMFNINPVVSNNTPGRDPSGIVLGMLHLF